MIHLGKKPGDLIPAGAFAGLAGVAHEYDVEIETVASGIDHAVGPGPGEIAKDSEQLEEQGGRVGLGVGSDGANGAPGEAVKSGLFAPPALVGPIPFVELQAMMAQTETALKAFTPNEVNRWAGRDLDFQIGPRRLPFTAENFFLSFSLPNFHFHAVTAYDILRSRGVPLGKRDYEGRLRTRPA